MKILSMTATFGKLDNETLTFTEGLNIITAPNEWGKSTWCAFMVAMLYGIETSQRTSSKGLADKERYAPWSGKPMSGRMDILWNGRKITLERSTKGRSIFGLFRAYETESGMAVPELTADNCGLTLLGVEKNVFTRAGFLKLTDMPVTDDQALRRRLNALVTTGDESGASDYLAAKLHDLDNKCSRNKTGQLSQAKAQQAALQEKLDQISNCRHQMQRIKEQQAALAEEFRQLENHKAHLAYQKSKNDLQRVQAAKLRHESAVAQVRQLEAECATLPSLEFVGAKLQQLEGLQSRWTQLQSKALPRIPQAPAAFAGMDTAQAVAKAKEDKALYDILNRPISPLFLLLAGIALVCAVGLAFVNWLFSIPLAAISLVFLILHRQKKKNATQAVVQLCARYVDLTPENWVAAAEDFDRVRRAYEEAARTYNAEKTALEEDTLAVTGGKAITVMSKELQQTASVWEALEDAKQATQQAASHAEALSAVVKDVPAPQAESNLTLSPEMTEAALLEKDREQKKLEYLLGQYKGQMETLGSEEAIGRELTEVLRRIDKLEDMRIALQLAKETLESAANELQRRFAPRIAQKAKELFEKLTGGRYDRLILEQDLSLSVGAQGEDTLHSAPWRSDGTVDQLYLALRLAVAGELTPDAPLVLDDALVRFDDNRLKAALAILKEEAETRQVLLFTCQSREQEFV